jgi:hypothetical protein
MRSASPPRTPGESGPRARTPRSSPSTSRRTASTRSTRSAGRSKLPASIAFERDRKGARVARAGLTSSRARMRQESEDEERQREEVTRHSRIRNGLRHVRRGPDDAQRITGAAGGAPDGAGALCPPRSPRATNRWAPLRGRSERPVRARAIRCRARAPGGTVIGQWSGQGPAPCVTSVGPFRDAMT